jgi:hypothetical protein
MLALFAATACFMACVASGEGPVLTLRYGEVWKLCCKMRALA